MRKPDGPCHECEEREIGCHASCERYADYQKKMLEFNHTVNDARWASYRPGTKWPDYRVKMNRRKKG